MEEVLDLEHGAQTPPLRLRLCHLLLFHCLPLASQQLQPRDNSRSSEKEKNTEFCHNRKPNKLTLEHKSAGDLHCNVVIWSIMIVFVFFTATKWIFRCQNVIHILPRIQMEGKKRTKQKKGEETPHVTQLFKADPGAFSPLSLWGLFPNSVALNIFFWTGKLLTFPLRSTFHLIVGDQCFYSPSQTYSVDFLSSPKIWWVSLTWTSQCLQHGQWWRDINYRICCGSSMNPNWFKKDIYNFL